MSTLFTELTLSEEASLSGGRDEERPRNRRRRNGGNGGNGGDGGDGGFAVGGDGLIFDSGNRNTATGGSATGGAGGAGGAGGDGGAGG